jgi:hypothetical protein
MSWMRIRDGQSKSTLTKVEREEEKSPMEAASSGSGSKLVA